MTKYKIPFNNKKIPDPQQRFLFGKNWTSFLSLINEECILEAEKSLKENLKLVTLEDKTFLDIGSGSGLFSLAAHRLGAKVFSFDYDEDAVNCTKYLKEKYAHNDNSWIIDQGSVLNNKFLKKFNKVDVLYSWGVLHHTGHMYQALENIVDLVKDNGLLFISIYNDQGRTSKMWKWIKQRYNSSPKIVKFFLCMYTLFVQWSFTFLKDSLKTGNPIKSWVAYGRKYRGMSAWHDVVDWTGGYPFEVAKPEEIFDFFKTRDFELQYLKTCGGGNGCNEFIFQKKS